MNYTSPTHPGLTARLQEQNDTIEGTLETFAREGERWVLVARDAEIDRQVPSEFRGRAPLGAP